MTIARKLRCLVLRQLLMASLNSLVPEVKEFLPQIFGVMGLMDALADIDINGIAIKAAEV